MWSFHCFHLILITPAHMHGGKTPEGAKHGILRSTPPVRKSAATGVRWDEANLAETSADAGTRMRIDEPKTPWVAGSPGAASLHGQDVEALVLGGEATSGAESVASTAGSGSVFSATESEAEDAAWAEHHAAFEAARKRHYCMEAAPAVVQRVSLDGDVHDEDDDEYTSAV